MHDTPSPEDFKEFLRKHGLSGSRAGFMLGINDRTVRSWTAPAGRKMSRVIPWTAWTLLRLLIGDTDIDAVKKDLEEKKRKEAFTT